jgi:uncharacterized protein YndB with AHSA1/START domain
MPDVHHVSVSVDRPPEEVYEFAGDPRNLPRWAAGPGALRGPPGGRRLGRGLPDGESASPLRRP